MMPMPRTALEVFAFFYPVTRAGRIVLWWFLLLAGMHLGVGFASLLSGEPLEGLLRGLVALGLTSVGLVLAERIDAAEAARAARSTDAER